MSDLEPEGWTAAAYIAGDPALDFINTVSDDGKTRRRTRLTDWERLTGWTALSGLCFPEPVPTAPPPDAAARLAHLHTVREAAHDVLVARQDGDTSIPVPDHLTRAFRDAVGRARMVCDTLGARWIPGPGPHMLADGIVLSLHRLFMAGPLDRVRQCGRCSWFFLDSGRGRRRQWCSMRLCGNRTKVEAHRRRVAGA